MEAGSGAQTCVLLHGIANTWRFWTAVAAGLAHDHRVIAFDLPGFGDSDLLDGPLTARAVGSAVLAACDDLGVEGMTVAGHSMGGLVALSMAAAHPERVERCAIVGGALISILKLYDSIANVVRSPAVAARFALIVSQGAFPTPAWLLDRIARSPALRRASLSAYLRWPARLPAAPIRDCLVGLGRPGVLRVVANAGRFDLAATAAAVRCPVLVVNGRQDRISPVADAARLADQLANCEVALLDDTGHWPMVERPNDVTELVGAFVSAGRT